MSEPMSDPAESERRKRRDADIRCQDEAIGRHLAEALRSGELQTAASFGRPMPEPEGWSETPTAFRMAFKILKNAGAPPPEIDLFHQRARLRAELEAVSSDCQRQVLQQRLSELEQALALRLEGMRVSGKL